MFWAASAFLFFLFIQLLLSIESFRGGIGFLGFVKRDLARKKTHFDARAMVFIPCKGLEDGLPENLSAIVSQDLDNTSYVFVVEDDDDPAVKVIEKLSDNNPDVSIFVSGIASHSGQKVHNLITAVEKHGSSADVYVFADSDARPASTWLRSLIEPLYTENADCTSGYRWFAPESFGVASQLRSAWNASITSSLGEKDESNFCWGGSMAIKRETFEKLKVTEAWRGTVSDDFVLTNTLKTNGLGIRFIPACLNPSVDTCSIGEFLEFATRQMKITRVYSPDHFKISVIGSTLFTLTFFGSILLSFVLNEYFFTLNLAMFAAIFVLGTGKSLIRLRAVQLCLPEQIFFFDYIWHALLWPFAAVAFLVADIGALLSREITWRGIRYELVSDKETRILSNE